MCRREPGEEMSSAIARDWEGVGIEGEKEPERETVQEHETE